MILVSLSLVLVSTVGHAQSPVVTVEPPVASPIPSPSPIATPNPVASATPSSTPTNATNPTPTVIVSNTPTHLPISSASPSAPESAQPQFLGANPTLSGALIIGLIAVALMIGIYYATRRM
ncbi:MAG TPA: hypothetical protein VEG44_08580 [Candidatus Acidoferrales bacterium]|nr:hypothetical protein [Candidatus Acidoferrales bacterium]